MTRPEWQLSAADTARDAGFATTDPVKVTHYRIPSPLAWAVNPEQSVEASRNFHLFVWPEHLRLRRPNSICEQINMMMGRFSEEIGADSEDGVEYHSKVFYPGMVRKHGSLRPVDGVALDADEFLYHPFMDADTLLPQGIVVEDVTRSRHGLMVDVYPTPEAAVASQKRLVMNVYPSRRVPRGDVYRDIVQQQMRRLLGTRQPSA